jgi:hypothetical protein
MLSIRPKKLWPIGRDGAHRTPLSQSSVHYYLGDFRQYVRWLARSAHVGNKAAARLDEPSGKPKLARHSSREMGVGFIKAADPTRPVFIHNGGSVGDIYTINNYLNFIPLQEREEWLSAYARNGDMPLMYVEFGTPVNISMMRGRNGFQRAYVSESWLTEFASIYLGNDAYKLEPADYRKRVAEIFIKDQTYQWSQQMRERDYAPSWMRLQDLFISNTWRSWRTMGMTGGMIHGTTATLN